MVMQDYKSSMRKVITLILLLASLPLLAVGKDESYRFKMINNLNTASEWLIQNGVQSFQKGGKEAISRKLFDDWGVQLWVDPWIESERYINGFWIKARGIHHNVLDLHRERVGDNLYEFWVVQISGEEWSGIESNSVFYVTKTDSKHGAREILKKSETFIGAFEVDEKHTITFPKDDIRILYELRAWDFHESYVGSGVITSEVVIDLSGNYRFAK